MAEINYDQLVAIGKEAGQLAMAGWAAGKIASNVWEKTPGHIVSSVDIAVDDFLKDRLNILLPDAGWLSEETADDSQRQSKDFVWVVDPIDGTKDFVKGKTGWAVSIALVQNGVPVFGILEAPAMKETWVAKSGSHSEVNGRAIKASTRKRYDGSRIPLDTADLPSDIDLIPVTKPNSIALRMAMVADNRADLVASIRWGHEWDIAAAHVIASEAGALVSDALGHELHYNSEHGKAFGVLCTAPEIHDAAAKRLSKIAEEVLARD
ncbi:3'(2'),5'-bisphosphate nucleotidase CysQ [Parasphingorhabdus sp. JC815]|uniref:3'(2'),5'-bisphosphate nucleotidase CysQ n=1 Tax=Parasphingorhabdus sp. JC815 TaxID=3232140 RepID=UPI003458C2D8